MSIAMMKRHTDYWKMHGLLQAIKGTWLAAGLLALAFFITAPLSAEAQAQKPTECEVAAGQANPCLSFDPAVNPLLKGYGYYGDESNESEPKTGIPDRPGACKLYSAVGSGIVSGCLNGEVFTIYGSSGVIEGGGWVTQDSEGNIDAGAGAGPGDSCSSLPCLIRNLPGYLFVGIAYGLLTLSSLILFMAGTVFNFVVVRTVFQFGTYFGTSDGMLIAWGVMRDVANIGLLFGFIFMGVLLILNVDGGGHGHGGGISARKAIPRLIIFAILINFSLFASQAVIDVANAFSAQFTTLAGQECATTGGEETTIGGSMENCVNNGISGKMLSATGVTAIWDSTSRDWDAFMRNAGTRPYSYAVSIIMLSLFVLVTAMVLLAGAIMLAIRVIVLSLLMVTSPIGFAGMAIPKLQSIASDWWHRLISQAFFAPVYLLLIFISIKLTENLMQGEATLANAIIASEGSGVSGNMQVVMVFLIVIGFMIASLVAASKMGAVGAKFATQSAAALTVGSVGFVGRRTMGVGSSKVAERIRKSNWGHTETGRLFAGIADKGAKSSYSLRNLGNKVPGLDMGKANKTASGGYDAILHHGQEAREKYAKSLEQSDEDNAKEKAFKKEKENIESEKKAAQKSWETEKQELQDGVADLESQNKFKGEGRAQERKVAEAKLNAALARNDTEAARNAEEALKTLAAEHQEQAKSEVEAVAALRRSIREREQGHKKALEDFDKRAKEIDEEIKGRIDDEGHVIKVGVGSNASKYRYAKDLHKDRFINKISAGGRASHHAAASIVRNAGKSKLEKALGEIKDATEKGGDGHGDDHGGGNGGGHDAGGGHGGHGGAGHGGGGGHH